MFPMNVKGRRGFTVVEAAIGIMVFLVAMVGVTIVFTSGGGAIHQSVRGSQANQLASEKLAEICRREFYIPFDGTNPQDIDDGEMVGGSIDTYYNTAVGNIDQLTNPGFANNYGDIAGYPNCKMAIAVQYQELVPESPVPVPDTGEVIGSPVPAMKAGWGPITVGNDEPFDDVGIKLNLIKVQVTVYYRSASGDVDVACTVDALVNYNEVDVGPKVYSVSPSGFELNHLHSFTVYGDDFSDDTADNSVKPTVKITKTGFSDEPVSVDGANSTKTMLKCTATVTQPHGASSIYWDVKVINIDNMANSLARCLYEIEDTPYITSLDPNNGIVGDWVKINGYDFGTKGAGEYVAFNGVQAIDYNNPAVPGNPDWNNNTIWAKVPAGTTTGYVVVHKSIGNSNGVVFEIAGSVFISSINNIETGKYGASGDVGDTVRVYGSGFGAAQDAGDVVSFNGVNATVYSIWSDDGTIAIIECDVPPGATTGNVVVTNGGVSSNGVNFVIPWEAGH